jgi:hypothetical protein
LREGGGIDDCRSVRAAPRQKASETSKMGARSRTRPRKNLAGPQSTRRSDFGRLGQSQRIIDINAKVSNRVLYLGVSKQDLNGSKVTGRLVNECRLGAA